MLTILDGVLSCDGQQVERAHVLGFEERYDPWRGQAALWIRGTDHVEPIGSEYGATRRALRVAFPDRPFVSDWGDGVFPSMPGGLPAHGVRVALVVVGVVLAGVLGSGPLPAVSALPLAVVVGWGVAGAMGQVRMNATGMSAGATWAPVLAWHEVEHVHVVVLGRHVRVSVWGPRGMQEGTVPTVLLPALRAKVWRLGGLQLSEAPEPLDRGYARLAPVLSGLAGASLGIGALWAIVQPNPWSAWSVALAATVALALLAMAAEWRTSGWHTGAVLGMTALYGWGLLWISLGI